MHNYFYFKINIFEKEKHGTNSDELNLQVLS